MICKLYTKKTLLTKTQQYFSQFFDCKVVSQEIKNLTKNHIQNSKISPKLTVILSLDDNNKADPASQIYVNKKIQTMPELGIKSELIKVSSSIKKSEMQNLIKQLNEDPENTSTIIQLPFNSDFNFDINQIIGKIRDQKNVDGFSPYSTQEPNLLNPKTLKPPTALGIATLLGYYGIETQGKRIVMVGKGTLVGYPLLKMLGGYPYYATVTSCDIFTQEIKDITRQADILISACGEAEFFKGEDIKENAILIDAGINQRPILKGNKANHSDLKPKRRKIIGDISKEAYHKSKYYTPVPGGVGLLTVASLAANVLNSYLLQHNMPIVDIEKQLRFKHKLNSYLKKLDYKTKNIKVLLISSAYNGLTQKIQRTLIGLGYKVDFQIASSPQAMRSAVNVHQPDIIVCPTLMKAIPEDIYKKVKCLIVHPGIKGDRGPSSLDWAILNQEQEWGVTLLEADQEMDAGDIWGSQTFKIKKGQSKVEIYNKSVGTVAQKLVTDILQNKFLDPSFKPEKLDYNNPSVKGRLHKSIKFSDQERTIDWNTHSTAFIVKKSLAAETQPGLKIKLFLNGKQFTCFSYGFVPETMITPRSTIKNGEVFLRKMEAVCVKTMDGAVWIKQLRRLKTKNEPFPFKIPSTIFFGEQNMLSIQKIEFDPLEAPQKGTFQEISFEKMGQIGVLGFDFYNGAMSTLQCKRLAESLNRISKMKDIKVLVLKGSEKNWSNGINLNVIENAKDPKEEAWDNIRAINEAVKAICRMNDKITISAIQANAGAGGTYLGLATDLSFAADGIVLNPHYKKMGLYGSELHTLTAQKKFGFPILWSMKDSTRPVLVNEAIQLGLLNTLQQWSTSHTFLERVLFQAEKSVNNGPKLRQMILKKNEKARMIFKFKSLQQYERQELEEMKKDIFEDRNGFAEKRYLFVTKQTKQVVVCHAY